MPIALRCATRLSVLGFVLSLSTVLWTVQPQAHEKGGPESQPTRVSLSKADQRRLGIRTRRVDAPPEVLEVPGQVVMDPRHYARVMSDQAGIIDPPLGGFVAPGDSVKRGQLLAILRPTLSEPERRDLEAELAAARGDVQFGRLQIDSYSLDENEKLDVQLPTASLQILNDYRAALSREAQLARALSGHIEIHAPANGTVLRSAVRAGRTTGVGETLFELSSTEVLAVEVFFTENELDGAASTSAVSQDGRSHTVHFLGETFDPASRAHRALYALSDPDPSLSLGMTLRVRLPADATPEGRWRLPAASVWRQGEQSWVWTHDAAERFVAIPVQVEAPNNNWVQVESGLNAQQRVVVEGVSALTRLWFADGRS